MDNKKHINLGISYDTKPSQLIQIYHVISNIIGHVTDHMIIRFYNIIDANTLLEPKRKFEAKNNKKYKVKSIVNSMMYGKKVESQLLSFYYLVLQKSYLNKKSNQKSSIVVIDLWKQINIFYKEYSKKSITIFGLHSTNSQANSTKT